MATTSVSVNRAQHLVQATARGGTAILGGDIVTYMERNASIGAVGAFVRGSWAP